MNHIRQRKVIWIGFMRLILHLLPDLDFHAYARQASLLAAALPRTRFRPIVFCLNGIGPFATKLRQVSISVHGRNVSRRLDWVHLLSLRRLLAIERPAILHVWGIPALRSLWWATLGQRSILPRLVVSLGDSDLRNGRLSWFDRRLFNRVAAFVAAGEANRAAFIRAGLPAEKLHVIPMGVPLPKMDSDSASFRAANGIPFNSPLLMGIGHLKTADRFVDAVWALEILHLIDPTIRLALVGDGPNRQRLANKFLAARDPARGVHFLEARDDAASLLNFADVVLVPRRRSGGTYAVLEAMAAARPVVATNLPHLAELIRDGETGVLVPPGDRPAMAREILRLLEDPVRREQIGTAARDSVAKDRSVEVMAERYMELYENGLQFWRAGRRQPPRFSLSR